MIIFLMGAFRSRLSLQLEIAALRNQLAELEWLESPKGRRSLASAVLHHTRARQVMHERAGVKWRAQPIAISLLMAEISEGMLRDPDDTARPRLVPRRVRRHICARAISEEP